MEVRPASSGPAEPDPGLAVGRPTSSATPARSDSPVAPASARAPDDSVFLQQISASNLERILAAALPEAPPAAVAEADTMIRDALASIAEENIATAMLSLQKAILLDPRRAEALPSDPQFAPVSGQIDQLVARLAHGARLDAEVLGSRVSDALQGAATHAPAEWLKDATQVNIAALHLLEANSYVNNLRSAHISQAILDSAAQFNPALNVFVPPVPEPAQYAFSFGISSKLNTPESARDDRATSRFKARLIVFWRRAPLALLLLAWLAIGLGALALSALTGASRSAFRAVSEMWALGFLALVGLGFYARVRNIRFGR